MFYHFIQIHIYLWYRYVLIYLEVTRQWCIFKLVVALNAWPLFYRKVHENNSLIYSVLSALITDLQDNYSIMIMSMDYLRMSYLAKKFMYLSTFNKVADYFMYLFFFWYFFSVCFRCIFYNMFKWTVAYYYASLIFLRKFWNTRADTESPNLF